ncbi:MAG: hypothetical protein LWW85_07515 [Marinilabiliales bacterium]|nr:hypothetical protein [Marinilabiliales bacterium]
MRSTLRKHRVILLVLLVLVLGCKKSDPSADPQKGSYAYFVANIQPTMDYSALESCFGTPDKEMGSGIHIYVYLLRDQTEIWIGFSNKIIYVRHMDASHQLLDTLI